MVIRWISSLVDPQWLQMTILRLVIQFSLQAPHVWWRCCLTGSSPWPTWETLVASCATRMATRWRCRMTTSLISWRSARESRGQVCVATRTEASLASLLFHHVHNSAFLTGFRWYLGSLLSRILFQIFFLLIHDQPGLPISWILMLC